MEKSHAQQVQIKQEMIFPQQKYRIKIIGKPVKLILKRSFNTAHSSSTTRTNFIIQTIFKCGHPKFKQGQIQISQNQYSGFGQCGLPPKKPFCYLADINDCQKFINLIINQFKSFNNQLKQQAFLKQKMLTQFNGFYHQLFDQTIQSSKNQQFKPFQFFHKKFNQLMNNQCQSSQIYFYLQVFYLLCKAKQISQQNNQFKAPRNALQFSLLDLIGKLQLKSVSQFICGKKDQFKLAQNFSFYTISHQQNLQSMIQNGKDSLIFTNYIKIKFNNDVQKLIQLLIKIDQQQIGQKWIIDANACWSPSDYIKFQQLFNKVIKQNTKIKNKVLFIQQPFPIFKALLNTKTSQQIQKQQVQWENIKQKTSFIIIADQSFASCQDLQKVMQYSHGINIKMQKCGGPLEGAKILNKLKDHKIQHLMFGSMVSTHLGCTQTFQFYQYAKYFDIDGALLVKQPQISGGFEWKGKDGICKVQGNGLSINKSDIQKFF